MSQLSLFCSSVQGAREGGFERVICLFHPALSHIVSLAQKGPGLLLLHAIQAGFTEKELAQLVKGESWLGAAASFTGIIGRL